MSDMSDADRSFLSYLSCRFGSFEICKATDPSSSRAGPSAGLSNKLIPQLLGFTMRSYFPDIWRVYSAADDITLKSLGQSQVRGAASTGVGRLCEVETMRLRMLSLEERTQQHWCV
jgi:hypothetical protein